MLVGKAIFELLVSGKQKKELERVIRFNEKTKIFGLVLTQAEAEELILCRNESLKRYGRVEFGDGILEKLMEVFCDSQYIDQDNYLELLKNLQDVFYEFKNETNDQMMDDELLAFMKEQFETICMGEITYLEETCLERFSRAVRGGYERSGGYKEYEKLSEEERWDSTLYLEVLKELC